MQEKLEKDDSELRQFWPDTLDPQLTYCIKIS